MVESTDTERLEFWFCGNPPESEAHRPVYWSREQLPAKLLAQLNPTHKMTNFTAWINKLPLFEVEEQQQFYRRFCEESPPESIPNIDHKLIGSLLAACRTDPTKQGTWMPYQYPLQRNEQKGYDYWCIDKGAHGWRRFRIYGVYPSLGYTFRLYTEGINDPVCLDTAVWNMTGEYYYFPAFEEQYLSTCFNRSYQNLRVYVFPQGFLGEENYCQLAREGEQQMVSLHAEALVLDVTLHNDICTDLFLTYQNIGQLLPIGSVLEENQHESIGAQRWICIGQGCQIYDV